MATASPSRPRDRRMLGPAVAVVVALGVAGACTGSDGSGPSGPTLEDGDLRDPSGLTADELKDVDTCRQLHDTVLTWLDAAAARARDLQGDGDALDVMVDSLMEPDGPLPGLEALEGLFPAAPYAGIAGPEAARRYEELGCEPADELRRILDWFGLPEDTPITTDEGGPLAEALTTRLDDLGAGGFVAVGLGRRLVEGVALPGSPLMEALADVARAQEAHRAATGAYAGDLSALVPYLDDPTLADGIDPDRPVVVITAADADAYCVHGADGPSAVVESHDGIPRSRVPGTPSCPNTFPDLDEG
ncbi:MAG: hypothetical protein ACLGI8_02405 [Acidimicrobiia bacterium]